jgi:cellulose synthase/poly-beta-1,6-N-acetylglucosamine synthase-like glycosyltransferase
VGHAEEPDQERHALPLTFKAAEEDNAEGMHFDTSRGTSFGTVTLANSDGNGLGSEVLENYLPRGSAQNSGASDLSWPLVSITVPTYNNVDTIAQCVESLGTQEYRRVEVIVVDDGSTDGTGEVVKRLQSRYPNVRLVRTRHFGASHARNVGIGHSKGHVFLFADGDAIYSSDYLVKSVDLLMVDSRMGAVCVTGSNWIQKNTFVSRGIALEYEMKQKFLNSGKWKPYFAFVYTKKAIEQVGGFDETLFQGEDKDLFNRVKGAGFHIGLVRGFRWFHRYPQDLRSLVSRSYRGGKQRVVYVAKRRMYGEVIRRTAGLWGLVILVGLSPFLSNGFLLVAIVLTLVYFYKLLFGLKNGWGRGRFSDFLLLPVVSAVRYLTTAVGYSKGLFVYMFRRILGLQTTWANM